MRLKLARASSPADAPGGRRSGGSRASRVVSRIVSPDQPRLQHRGASRDHGPQLEEPMGSVFELHEPRVLACSPGSSWCRDSVTRL